MKNFSIRLPEGDRKEVAKIAEDNGVTDGHVIRLAVRHYLKAIKRRKGASK